MGNLFGRSAPKPLPISQHDLAILQLKCQRDKMKQYIKRNEKQMEREKQVVLKLLKMGNRDRALLILKKKRYQGSVIEKALKQLDQLNAMVTDLEFAKIEERVINELRRGKEALEQINKMFSLDDIENIMAETAEAARYQEEISEMLSGRLNDAEIQDVESELQKLLENETEAFVMPEVPSDRIVAEGSGEGMRERLRVGA